MWPGEQGFSASALWTFWAEQFIVVENSPVHCRVFVSTPGVHLLDVNRDNQKRFQTLLTVPLVALRPIGLAGIVSKYKHHFAVKYFLPEHTFHQGRSFCLQWLGECLAHSGVSVAISWMNAWVTGTFEGSHVLSTLLSPLSVSHI